MDSSMEIIDGHMHMWTPATHLWLDGVRDGGHPAGNFGKQKVNVGCLDVHAPLCSLSLPLEPIMTYLVDDYKADVAGYNVSTCVHVEACWPETDDPVDETK